MTADEETVKNTQEQVVEETKSAKKARVGGPRGTGGVKKAVGSEPPRKRGPPRPHRKLPQDVLDGRIGKLRKRIERARGQLEDAERHIEGYDKEAKYREQEKKN
jgi:hypothetical protein